MASNTCGWCSHLSHMTRVGPTKVLRLQFSDNVTVMSTFACDNCGRYSVGETDTRHENVRNHEPGEWLDSLSGFLSWTPARGRQVSFDDVPAHISAAASEAVSCMSIGAFRATVQMARSVVEASAKERGYRKGRLVDKINEMFDDRLLRPHIKDAADEIRFLGNDMAHGDFVEPVSEEEADEVLGLMYEVLRELFQSPAEVARRREARAAKAERRV